VNKVAAYITHGSRLLVFRHTEFPEAGTQVPGGTVEPGEDLVSAVLREATEETGLVNLTVVRLVGVGVYEPPELPGHKDVRAFFHLTCSGEVPERWRHMEEDPSDGSPAPIEFEHYWVDLPDAVPELAGEMDVLLTVLLEQMGLVHRTSG
jgi:ADP-ribose pyrophosphatase YjhB (NUDIX family)